ncbi:MAG: hypothetical protein CBD69_004845 [Crocinitomicaceae bacterium TMED209]|nr:MAG: hypothetical protein CBD69_004845 [Crocinitomicaceae bacterium TMED209]
MKYFLTCLALGIAFASGAQTWNPDADFDNVIGVEDLMALLSVFGTEWTAEYPQDPEFDLAAYDAGYFGYYECIRSCTNNHGKIIGLHEYAMFQDSIDAMEPVIIQQYPHVQIWLDGQVENKIYSELVLWNDVDNSRYFSGINVLSVVSPNPTFAHCICTGLVPAVE